MTCSAHAGISACARFLAPLTLLFVGGWISGAVFGVQAGFNGANGLPGDPGGGGGPGGPGPDRTAIQLGDPGYQVLFTYAESGGNGGRGGDGEDGDDPDASATGGPGGEGGRGGNVNVRWNGLLHVGLPWEEILANVRIEGHGGRGGNGGEAGISTGGSATSAGGNGGDGGRAMAWGQSRSVTSIRLQGGRGGQGFGPGSRGGNGGVALGEAISGGQSALFLKGGNGGLGTRFARGGDGASVYLGAGFNRLGIDPAVALNDRSFLRTSLAGGAGGASVGSFAGRAGTALLEFDRLFSHVPVSEGRFRAEVLLELYGGAGGATYASHGTGENAADGAGAFLTHANVEPLVFEQLERSRFDFTIVGGAGGNALGAGHPGNGGNGGLAWFQPMTLVNHSDSGFFLPDDGHLSVSVQGGAGGSAEGQATIGGFGSTALLLNPFSIQTAGAAGARVRIEATGGQGGFGSTLNGNGGNAYAIQDQPLISNLAEPPGMRGRIELTLAATSGEAGDFTPDLVISGRSGDAFSRAIQQSSGQLNMDVQAVTGNASSSFQGDARAVAVGESSGIEGNGRSAVVRAVAGSGPVRSGHQRPVTGGRSSAVAQARVSGGVALAAVAEAAAGTTTASGSTGAAQARAEAINQGLRGVIDNVLTDAPALATASAYAGDDPDPAWRNNALAEATSYSFQGTSHSRATANARGLWSRAQANAAIDGRNGDAFAVAQASHLSLVEHAEASAQFEGRFNSTTDRLAAATSAFIGIHGAVTGAQLPHSALSHALLLPDRSVVEAAVPAGGLDAEANLFTWGILSAGLQPTALPGDGSLGTASGMEFRMLLDEPLQTGNLRLAFVDSQTDLPGFESARLSIVSGALGFFRQEQFDSLAAAQDFFSRNVIDLGNLDAVTLLDFRIGFSVALAETRGNFRFRYILSNDDPFDGNAARGGAFSVPDPGVTWAWLVIAWMASFRCPRRRL